MTNDEMRALLHPYQAHLPDSLVEKLQVYLSLLLRWNATTNLTAVREAQAIVQRHFGESLFAASLLPTGSGTLLDIGSGAGFPGLPIALWRADLRVTLGESQGKKAAFLQEASRTLALANVTVFAQRVESLPPQQQFDIVTARAVDKPGRALEQMIRRTRMGGTMMHLCGLSDVTPGSQADLIPGSNTRVVERRVRSPHALE